ncbi:uncharacterized protein LOC104448633 [Eucalyptus grandis]|uniref:uncharacterized protein LOC104448633 n=1 Tax=Eucalyptus grandis TaxID=71139 RepID=UPI000525837C|nr:uncharacterized protein LOC104448633 [Eucalyptus grandis]
MGYKHLLRCSFGFLWHVPCWQAGNTLLKLRGNWTIIPLDRVADSSKLLFTIDLNRIMRLPYLDVRQGVICVNLNAFIMRTRTNDGVVNEEKKTIAKRVAQVVFEEYKIITDASSTKTD